MKITLYTADCIGDETNCQYPHQQVITDAEGMVKAARYDQVFAKYTNSYRTIENFEESSCIPQDCDNDHSENPDEWMTAEKLREELKDVAHVILPSRNNMKWKGGKSPRPRLHILFPVRSYTDAQSYNDVKTAIQNRYPFLDKKALNAARFFFGSEVRPEDVVWNEGICQIDDILEAEDFTDKPPIYVGSSIPEGSRNNTMSHFASRVLKRFGDTDKAYAAYLERAEKCEPLLSGKELGTIWKSALKFFKNKVEGNKDYVAPDEYNNEFGSGFLKPDDYSDLGEAKIMVRTCLNRIRYTAATRFIAYGGDRWYEDSHRALKVVEDFMDEQLQDADEAIRTAEENLIALGIPAADVKARNKNLANQVPAKKLNLLYVLQGADTYKKFVMKYRNYRNFVSVQKATAPMLALDISELDYDAELLNTPDATYDLTKGTDGGHPHDPDDLITKITACSPGDKGEELWQETLELFFCGDKELIDYVQQIVGMAAVGRVYAEQMIIAYGGGANGKSTFWNTIARVLGNYSGKISAETLTMGCKRNVKPEMAELKGKRLIIASELEEGTRLNTGMVKQICSTDPIEAEKKYKDPFHFDPSHTLVLYTNHLPRVSANDEGTWRRLIIIPFNARITGASDIKNYSEHLFDKAGPAILKWIIEGAEMAIKNEFKFDEPDAVQKAVAQYREDNDWLGQFIEEYCDLDPSFTEKSGELYQQYRVVCMQTGEYIRSTTDFYGNLKKAGYVRKRTNKGSLVSGLKLKEGQDFLD